MTLVALRTHQRQYINRTQDYLILFHNNFGWGDSNSENKFDLNLDGLGRNNDIAILYDYQFRNHIIKHLLI